MSEPGPTADPGGRQDDVLRVVTFNTYVGRGIEEALWIVRTFEPHLMFLQELGIYRRGDWEWRQPDEVARQAQMNHAYLRLVFRGRTEFGLSLYSAGRIRDVSEIGGPGGRPTGLSARVDLAGRTLSVAAVHLAAVPRPLPFGILRILTTHRRQVARALKRLDEMGGPAILAGDFNSLPGTAAHRLACRHMTDVARETGTCASTRRTWGLPLRIDYIFASAHFRCEACQVLPSQVSDHRPVLATLRWTDA
jgi:endonuclease/exonuclease/phosphatase family metal-dependent hydrolase